MVEDRRKDSLNDSRNGANPSSDFRRIEVITGVARRRRWTDDEKARIVSESFEPGVGVSAVARRYGLYPSLIYGWRRHFCCEADGKPSLSVGASFVPVVMNDEQKPIRSDGVIEVVLGVVTVRVTGAVDGASLHQVLDAVRRLG